MTSAPKQALAQHCQEQLASLRALADELEADDWEAPSLCTGWDVKTVYAHLLYGRLIGPLPMLAGIARHHGRIDRWDDALHVDTPSPCPCPSCVSTLRVRPHAGRRRASPAWSR